MRWTSKPNIISERKETIEMRIQHNIMAMNAYRNYANNTSALSKNLEKLSSGYKINRAGDDAAGLAISEKMRAQITGLDKAQDNAKDGISLVQTAEGALTEVHDMLNRMYELAEQSANGTFEDGTDRKQLQKEVDQLKSEINRIADSANFNGIKLLDGSMAANGTTKINGAAAGAKAGVDVSIVADSLFAEDGTRSELKFSLAAVSSNAADGAKVTKNGVTISLKKGQEYSAADIQALLAKATASGTGVSDDMLESVQNATVSGTGITKGSQAWTSLAKSTGTAQPNQGMLNYRIELDTDDGLIALSAQQKSFNALRHSGTLSVGMSGYGSGVTSEGITKKDNWHRANLDATLEALKALNR